MVEYAIKAGLFSKRIFLALSSFHQKNQLDKQKSHEIDPFFIKRACVILGAPR